MDLVEQLKKPQLLQLIKEYYESINRNTTPKYENYSLQELKQCIRLFNISLKKI